MRRRLRYVVLFAGLLGVACAGEATSRGATVIYASGADLQSINPLLTTHPLARQVQRYALLTTLVQYDAQLRPQPYLARSWTWSRDSLQVTMQLTTVVRWQDGQPTTAHDAAWTIDAARDPATGYPRASDLSTLRDVRAQDDSTLILAFNAPQRGIPDVLTDLAILPSHLFRFMAHSAIRRAAWNATPVGNGPFKFVSHTPNRRWVFAANPSFPALLGGPPHFERLVIAVVDEPTTKLAALTSGELDFAGIQPAHASFVRRDRRLAVIEYPLMLTYAIVLNTRRAPFDLLPVRRAISLAIDRRAIVDGYLFGFGTPATGPVAQAGGGPSSAPSDPASARALLRGRRVDFELLTVGSGEAALEQMLQAQLAAVGIEVHIRQLELSSFLDRVNGTAHDFDAAVMGITGDPGMGELTPLLETAGVHAAPTPEAALAILRDSLPVVFVYHARGVQGMNRRITGVAMDVRGELAGLHNWRVAP